MRIYLLKHLFCFACLRVGLYMYRATFNNISILFVEHSEPPASIKRSTQILSSDLKTEYSDLPTDLKYRSTHRLENGFLNCYQLQLSCY